MKKDSLLKINYTLISIIFISSSFDIFLTWKISGFSLRLSYLTCILFIVLNFNSFIKGRKIKFIGLVSFLVWTCFLLAFLFNTNLLSRNIGYFIWHVFHFVYIIIFVSVIDSTDKFNKILRIYLYSFYIIALIGILQFLLGLIGIGFFVEQWWFNNLPRVNGFSYEPSYYASYMIIGWTLSFVMLVNPVHIFSKRKTFVFFVTITLSILLSSSRLGLLFVFLVLFVHFLTTTHRILLRKKGNTLEYLYVSAFGFLSLVSILIIVPIIFSKYQFLLNGTGIQGQSAHSAIRFDIMRELIDIFVSNPFVGSSLGGIPSLIGTHNGVIVNSTALAKEYEGINVLLEVLVASGFFGFIFFIGFLIQIFSAPYRLQNKSTSKDNAPFRILHFLILSLLVELLILCFNQNILRFYLWIHIGLINAAYFSLKKETFSSNQLKEN